MTSQRHCDADGRLRRDVHEPGYARGPRPPCCSALVAVRADRDRSRRGPAPDLCSRRSDQVRRPLPLPTRISNPKSSRAGSGTSWMRHSPGASTARRASSFLEHRTRTTRASSTSASLCAGASRARSRPALLFDLLQSDGPDVRAYDAARDAGAVRGTRFGNRPTAVAGRSSPGDRAYQYGAGCGADGWWRFVVAAPRMSRGPRYCRCSVHSGNSLRTTTPSLAGEAADDIAQRPPLDGPRVLLAGAPVDGPVLHAAIESHGAIVVEEVGPWGSGAAGDDVACAGDPLLALGGQIPPRCNRPAYTHRRTARLDLAHARQYRCRRCVVASRRYGFRLGLPGAARSASGATHSAHLFAWRSVSATVVRRITTDWTRWSVQRQRLRRPRA